METTVPNNRNNRQDELLKIVMDMNNDYDNGFREFQEAIHYAIFHMFVNGSKNCKKREAVNYILYLRDLRDRLHMMEEVMKQPE